jgi:hypothetical protein
LRSTVEIAAVGPLRLGTFRPFARPLIKTLTCLFLQVLKALALYMTSDSKVLPDNLKQDVLKIVETVKTANKGAAMNDADVLEVLNHVLRETGQGASSDFVERSGA